MTPADAPLGPASSSTSCTIKYVRGAATNPEDFGDPLKSLVTRWANA